MTLEEISREASRLDQNEQVELAYRLFDRVGTVAEDGFASAEVREFWLREAERRSADLRAGRTSASDLSDVMARIRSRR